MDVTPFSDLRSDLIPRPFLYLVTAPSGAGKTAFCAALAERARAAGWDVAGLLSLPSFENGTKTRILVRNLRDGETRPLAALDRGRSIPDCWLRVGHWQFSSLTLAWGNAVLASCLPADLFIVDELGPLELRRGQGWINALDALRSQRYRIGLVVVRPELVDRAWDLLPVRATICRRAALSPQEDAYLHWKGFASSQ